MRNRFGRSALRWLAAAAAVGLLGVAPALGASVTPTLVGGNPDCGDYGLLGFKIDANPPGGPNAFTFVTGTQHGVSTALESGTPASSNTVTVTNLGGSQIAWSSSIGIAKVMMKGGNAANVYAYSPSSTGDTGLVTPNNSSGGPAGISHVTFCFKPALKVTKTATAEFERRYTWSIDKSVKPGSWSLFTGDTADSDYEIAVVKTGSVDGGWKASGTITIENSSGKKAMITGVSDVIDGFGAVAVTCPDGTSFPLELASGASLVCTYSTSLPNGDDRLNTATVTTTGDVEGGTGKATIDFGEPTKVVDASVQVVDDMATDSTADDRKWTVDGTTTLTYSRTFGCDDDEGRHVNKAKLVLESGDGGSDRATVSVMCYGLTVTKDAQPAYERVWTWSIEKSADTKQVEVDMAKWWLSGGKDPIPSALVEYEVVVDAKSSERNHAVTGTIRVANDNPSRAAAIKDVSDLISPDIAANVVCPSDFPLEIAAGKTLECAYSAKLPDKHTRLNTATAVLQNYHYASDGTATAGGTSSFEGTASVDFAKATVTEIDEKVSVKDTRKGVLGEVPGPDAAKTFQYVLELSADLLSGELPKLCEGIDYDNTASFLTNDTGTTGSSSWAVRIVPICDPKWTGGGDPKGGYDGPHGGEQSQPQQPGLVQVPAAPAAAAAAAPAPAPLVSETAAATPACVAGSLGSLANAPFFRSGTSWGGVVGKTTARSAYFRLARATALARLAMRAGALPGQEAAASLRWAIRYLKGHGPAFTAERLGAGRNGELRALRALMRHHAAVLRGFARSATCD